MLRHVKAQEIQSLWESNRQQIKDIVGLEFGTLSDVSFYLKENQIIENPHNFLINTTDTYSDILRLCQACHVCLNPIVKRDIGIDLEKSLRKVLKFSSYFNFNEHGSGPMFVLLAWGGTKKIHIYVKQLFANRAWIQETPTDTLLSLGKHFYEHNPLFMNGLYRTLMTEKGLTPSKKRAAALGVVFNITFLFISV